MDSRSAALSYERAEWQSIEVGVAQRARLLNAVLGDLYGKQELLSQGGAAGRDPVRPSEFSLALSRPASAGRPLAFDLRRRSRALGRRPLVGSCRPHASAVGPRVCARESPDRAPRLSRTRAVDGRAAARRVLCRASRGTVARRRRGAAGRGALARLVQRDLLRARVSRAPARLSPGRRPRSHRARRERVLEDSGGLEARARHSAQARR